MKGDIIVQIRSVKINPLSAELSPICNLLALLGAHHILHVSRVRVNSIYIYIYIYMCRFQWPRGLRLRSAAARLLGLRVRIPREHGCPSLVYVVYYAGRSLCEGPIPRSEESYQVCVNECDQVHK